MGVPALKVRPLFNDASKSMAGSRPVTDSKYLAQALKDSVLVEIVKGNDPGFLATLESGLLHQDIKGHLDEDLVKAVAAGVAPPEKKATFFSHFKKNPSLSF